MALDAYTQGLTAQEIVGQCETMAGSPGLNLHPTTKAEPVNLGELKATPAYRQLRALYIELALEYEWAWFATGTNLAIAGRENTLPLDFWRVQMQNPVWLLDGEERYRLHHLAPEQFFARMRRGTMLNRPTTFTIDRSRSTFYVDPAPDKGYLAELHYYRRPNLDHDEAPDRLAVVTDIVRFPHTDLLTEKLLAWYYRQQDDSRYPTAKAEAAEMLQRIRASSDDDRDSAAAIPLDSLVFGPVFNDY